MSKKEPKFEAGFGPSQSWRDKARNFALDKYGAEGKRIIDNILGSSEEDMALNYLQRTYGSELPEGVNVNRPMSDMLKYGMSDFGLVDAALFGMSAGASAIPRGIGTASAITESSLLAGDAVGEYQKGNNLGAAFMGTMVGAPPLLRYALGSTPPPKGQMEFQFQNVPDLKRRKFAQGLGLGAVGIGALSMMPGSVFRNFAPAAGKVAAKVLPINSTPVGQALSDMITVGSRDSYTNILENMPKFGGKTSRQLLLDYGETANEVNKLLDTNAHHWGDMAYPITDIFNEAGKYDRVLTFDEFKKIAADTPKRYPAGMPDPEFMHEGAVKLAYDIFEYEPFQKSAYNEYLRAMKFFKETPEGQDLVYKGEKIMKLRREAVRKFPSAIPGRANIPDGHPLTKAHSDAYNDLYYDALELYEGPMRGKNIIVDFNDPIVGQEISKNFPAISIDDPLRKFSPSKDLPNEDTSLIFGPTEDGMQLIEKLAEKMIDK
tara:strand:- start:445 stop:1911 length:1467 start_codon:yes stop_codon:yes gene_type:complete